MGFGVDYAFPPHPDIRALTDAQTQFVCRYVSHDDSKDLSADERTALHTAGIDIVLVWETDAYRPLSGFDAGAQDARDALPKLASLGFPQDRPLYFAADFDATAADQGAINAYLDGAASVLGHDRVGIYGGYWPLSRAMDSGHAAWAWQTYAWSGGQWYTGNHIEQYDNDRQLGGVLLDYDRNVKDDFGQWAPAGGPVPFGEDDMPNGTVTPSTTDPTPISLPKGRYTHLGLTADNGLKGLPAAQLRVAVHIGGGDWQVHEPIVVDSAKGQALVDFTTVHADVDGISVVHLDSGPAPSLGTPAPELAQVGWVVY